MSEIWLEQLGEGPDLVLIHGWGLHGGIWDNLVPSLASRYRVTRVDLPGHGYSTLDPVGLSVDELADRLLDVVPARAVWLGWSLGSLVALAAAQRADAVRGLILVAGTPRFVRGADWPHGMAPAVLQGFADDLRSDYEGTLRRFLGLHVGTGVDSRATIRALRERLFAHGRPSPGALAQGLRWLWETDLRSHAASINIPVDLIHGGYDRLVPPSAADWLVANLGSAQLRGIARAGHAPFLSHREEFTAHVIGAMEAGALANAG